MQININIPGKPIAQPRHQISKFGGRYLKKTSKGLPHPVIAYKEKIRIALEKEYKGNIINLPFIVKIYFCMEIPKSFKFKTDETIEYHIKKPDIDNLTKAVLDAIKNVWHDDSQIAILEICKSYDKNQPEGSTNIYIESGE